MPDDRNQPHPVSLRLEALRHAQRLMKRNPAAGRAEDLLAYAMKIERYLAGQLPEEEQPR